MFKNWLAKGVTKGFLKAVAPTFPFLFVTFLAVGLAFANTFQITCPICSGSGVVKTVSGLEAQIVDILQTDHHVPPGCCDNPYAEYTYYVTVTVSNPGSIDVKGNININFYEPGDSPPQAGDTPVYSYQLIVDVPAGKTLTYTPHCSLKQFGEMRENLHRVALDKNNLKTETDTPCNNCAGHGTIGLFEWLKDRV